MKADFASTNKCVAFPAATLNGETNAEAFVATVPFAHAVVPGFSFSRRIKLLPLDLRPGMGLCGDGE
jgi:hypothetical protein